MKLLKYVMTNDTGLAPNPFFDICSLALCTPNHMNAKLKPNDWVVAHSSSSTGQRLVYAMRLTEVLDMPTYFERYPEKRPDPQGTYEQRCGDNLYYLDGERWARLPSAEHNTVEDFLADRNRSVYIANGVENFWYFGAGSDLAELAGFADRFPWLVKDRQGFSYVRDSTRIGSFTQWLNGLDARGLIGKPRDRAHTQADSYLVGIDPTHRWIELDNRESTNDSSNNAKSCRPPRVFRTARGCSSV